MALDEDLMVVDSRERDDGAESAFFFLARTEAKGSSMDMIWSRFWIVVCRSSSSGNGMDITVSFNSCFSFVDIIFEYIYLGFV